MVSFVLILWFSKLSIFYGVGFDNFVVLMVLCVLLIIVCVIGWFNSFVLVWWYTFCGGLLIIMVGIGNPHAGWHGRFLLLDRIKLDTVRC